MAGTKGNRRIIYTKQVIKESLIKLLQKKEIHEVTVTDICKEADINRGTFYTHYKDAFDLLQSLEDELFNTLIDYIDQTPVQQYNDSLLLKAVQLIAENKDLCKILFCKQKDNRILNRILSVASKADFEQIYNNSSSLENEHLNYFIRYSVGGCISIIQAWLENDLNESPIDIVKIINSMGSISAMYFNKL